MVGVDLPEYCHEIKFLLNAWMAAPQIFATANIYGIHTCTRDHDFQKHKHKRS